MPHVFDAIEPSTMKEELRGFFRSLENCNEDGDQFVTFIRSAPASLSATPAALPCMSLIPVAPFLPKS